MLVDDIMNNTRTLAIVAVLTAAALVIGVGTFAPTTTQAKIESESSSTACVNDQPCQTTGSNSNTSDSPNVIHDRIHMSTTCVNDQPCQTTVRPPPPSDDDDEDRHDEPKKMDDKSRDR